MIPVMNTDCKHWRVLGSTPNCELALDLGKCRTCERRDPRNGNFIDPPAYYVPAIRGGVPRPNSKPIPKEESGKSKMAGLGDAVAAATKIVGIKPCSACEERRKKLNEMFPFNKQDGGNSKKSE